MARDWTSTVGEFFILGFRGSDIPPWLEEFASRFGLGGVILFDYDLAGRTYENNVRSPEQVRGLCRRLRALPSEPMIFIDQEGGKVRRLKERLGFEPMPSQEEFALLQREEKQRILRAVFTELRRLGITFNLAPVIDLNTNPENPDIGAVGRSYSENPEVVRENVRLMDAAARDCHVGIVLKHYPGLGGATVNSHEEITDISDSVSDTQLELFWSLAREIHTPAVLISHGLVTQWDPDRPVSLSETALGRLRAEVPEVLLLSDDMQMQGLQKLAPTGPACLQGLRAGLDMVIVGNNLMDEQQTIAAVAMEIARQAESDPALAEKLEAALRRIQSTKRRFH